jgi:hypothetical protein
MKYIQIYVLCMIYKCLYVYTVCCKSHYTLPAYREKCHVTLRHHVYVCVYIYIYIYIASKSISVLGVELERTWSKRRGLV